MPLPEIRHCLICEDIRVERRNLTSLMGVYGATPYVGIKIKNFKLPVTFCFFFMGAPGQGKFVVVPELHNPDGTRISAEVYPERFEWTLSPEMGASLLAFRIKATFAGPSIYTIVLMSGGTMCFKDTFNLALGTDADFI
jgi:hypothetical protein